MIVVLNIRLLFLNLQRIQPLKNDYVWASNASCASMFDLHASYSFSTNMYFQGRCTRAWHNAVKFTNRTEVSAIVTICSKGVCIIVQILPHVIVGRFSSTIKLNIPPIFVPEIIIRNRPHHSKCSVNAWNVVGQDSNSTRCGWSRSLTRSVQHGFSCRNKKNKQWLLRKNESRWNPYMAYNSRPLIFFGECSVCNCCLSKNDKILMPFFLLILEKEYVHIPLRFRSIQRMLNISKTRHYVSIERTRFG